ncbi:MAG: hypothetical protein A2Y20_05835 [Firmicutes bacterium GWF2_51_9]|nr:MAG: hypothetical protein A2Y20_05835 [Firmicutes bacterium GWF2_51_9]OGS58198.1 MAG: hypothetical protein A2Y19_03605 [Firmicutes bacterium GWE2_51_13]HAM63576.1 hypothetical protein [Erysipelotrichaceae bacterium]HBZ42039.1 hypothetical protein [Erysipelotrichaceae bacterium]
MVKMKKLISKYGLYVVSLVLGGIIGSLDNFDVWTMFGDTPFLLVLFALLGVMYLLILLNIFIHEAGHYFFGRISGYTLVSFRVKKWIFIKEDGKIVLKRFNVPGISGQCLMMPPQPFREDFPYKLYNHGGWIFNLITVAILSVFLLFVPMGLELTALLYFFALTALSFALTSGIPMKTHGYPNDGYDIRSMKKSADCRKAFYMQMHIHGVFVSGVRLEDMPEEWFHHSESADSSEPLIATLDEFRCSREFGKGETEEATRFAYELIQRSGLVEFQKNELRCVLLFNEVLSECRPEVIHSLYTKPLQKYIQRTSYMPARHRLTYALEKIYYRDDEKASKAKKKLERTLKTFPYRVEIEVEKKAMDEIDERANGQRA